MTHDEYCAGCYQVEPGVKIHPPKSSKEWLAWQKKWKDKAKELTK